MLRLIIKKTTMKRRSTLGIWIYLSYGLFLVFDGVKADSDSNSENVDCPPGWDRLRRGCYFYNKVFSTWEDALFSCEQDGATLASIADNNELGGIKKGFGNHVRSLDHINWWVGLQWNLTGTETWKWTDGGTYENVPRWAIGEPNNDQGNEDCGLLKFDGSLYDHNCEDPKPFICELIEAEVTTATDSTTITTTTSSSTSSATTKKSTPSRTTPTTRQVTRPTPTTPKSTSTIPSTGYPPRTTPTRPTTPQHPNRPDTTTTGGVVTTTGAPIRGRPQEFDGCFAVNYEATCPPVEAFGVTWPRTEEGKMARVECERGIATWKCQKTPTCWKGEPNIQSCTSEAIQDLTNQAEQVLKQNSSDAAVAFTEMLAESTSQGSTMSEQDLLQTTKLMAAASQVAPKNKSSAVKIVQNVLKCGNSIVSPAKQVTWETMGKENKVALASSLLNSMETITMSMMNVMEEPGVTTIQEENMGVELQVVSVDDIEGDSQSYEAETTRFDIPKEVLRTFSTGGLAKLVFINYKNVDAFMEPANEDGKTLELVSQVLSASINQETGGNLSEPVTFTMSNVKRDGRPVCAFWNFSQGYMGAWSNRGCVQVGYNDTHTSCKCYHLTNFAILMDVHATKISPEHETSLAVITYIGCIISIVCLFLSWLTFTCLSVKQCPCAKHGGLTYELASNSASSSGNAMTRTVQGERNSIHKHLVFCLFVAEILFLAGINRTDHKLACSIIAGCLHYFFLASFTWMFIEGIHILFMLVQVFDAAKSRMKYYYMIGYGLPLIPVGVSAAIFYQGYGTDKFCWLTTERMFIWSFAGPVAFILLVNLMILIYAMASVCKHSEYVFSKEKSQSGNLKFVFMTPYAIQMEERMMRQKGWIQGALALEVLLGLTWVLGYFYISQEAIPVAYLFTIFNSLQGLFIFIFHCLLNKKVRKEYKRFVEYRPQSTTTQTHSKSGSGSGTGSVPMTSSRKQSGPFTNVSFPRNGSTSA